MGKSALFIWVSTHTCRGVTNWQVRCDPVSIPPVYIIFHGRNCLGNTGQVMAKAVRTTSLALALHFFSTMFLKPPLRSFPEHDLNIQSLWDIKTLASYMSKNTTPSLSLCHLSPPRNPSKHPPKYLWTATPDPLVLPPCITVVLKLCTRWLASLWPPACWIQPVLTFPVREQMRSLLWPSHWFS